jgi:hypothetical protein
MPLQVMQMTDVIQPDDAATAKQVFLALAQISALIAGPFSPRQ